MWEDVFQIYRRFGGFDADLIASDLSLSDATIFIEAWMLKNYADEVSSLEIRRQPMDYGKNEATREV
jgi:hypothetical protein